MAEEKNEAQKPIIEMSVWFIVCLVILIIASILVIKLNGDKSRIAAERDSYIKMYEESEARNTTLRTRITNISADVFQKSPMEIQKALDGLVGSGYAVPAGAEETEVVPSGEAVAE